MMIIHFIINSILKYNEFIGIYSAYVANSPDTLMFHYKEGIKQDKNFETLKLLKGSVFEPLGDDTIADIFELKLNILYRYGGIILEKDIICYQKIPTDLDADLVLFCDGNDTDSISNFLIIAKKEATILTEIKVDNMLLFKQDSRVVFIHNEKFIVSKDSENVSDYTNTMLFHYNKKDYLEILEHKTYQLFMKLMKQNMIVKTPKVDSLYYSIVDLLVNSNRIPEDFDLTSCKNNTDIISINFTNVFKVAKDRIKDDIQFELMKNSKCDDVNDIIEIVNRIYNVDISIVNLKCGQQFKITKLKNMIINVVDNYYVTVL